MFQFFIGLLNVLFFGGGLLALYLKDKETLNWKTAGGSLIFVVVGVFLMFNSDFTSGETVVMETGNETFNNNDTVIAGNYEYTVKNMGTENTLEDFGDEVRADGKYLILEFIIKNNSNYPFSMDINHPFYLISDDKVFEFDYNLSWVFTNDEIGSSGLWSSDNSINPGNKQVSYAVFDVPEEIINSDQTQLFIFTDNSAPNNIYLNIN